MKATIKYYLTPAGQKASILAGGDGKSEQEMMVLPDNPHFEAVVRAGDVTFSGDIVIDLRVVDYTLDEPLRTLRFDSVPDVPVLLEAYAARGAAQEKVKAARAADLMAETETVLRERRVRSNLVFVSGGYVDQLAPAWPHGASDAIKNSPEAAAWAAELTAANEQALAAAKTKAEAEAAAKRVAAEAAARAEAERRTALGLEDGDIDLAVEDGALTAVPPGCWESHKRGKNWMATITADPSAPGGLGRSFAAKAKGSSYYLVPDLTPGDAIEFGADYYSGAGRKSPTRWYGFFLRRAVDGSVILRKCGTGKAAIKAGAVYRAALPVSA